jgi:hypothetical protein
MTLDELDALPENGDFKAPPVPMVHGRDDAWAIYDRRGFVWTTGRIDGVRYKARLSL